MNYAIDGTTPEKRAEADAQRERINAARDSVLTNEHFTVDGQRYLATPSGWCVHDENEDTRGPAT